MIFTCVAVYCSHIPLFIWQNSFLNSVLEYPMENLCISIPFAVDDSTERSNIFVGISKCDGREQKKLQGYRSCS